MSTQKIQNTKIAGIPAVIAGADTDEGFLFIHGKMGCKEEALDFAERAVPKGFQVAGIDLPEHGSRKNEAEKLVPWTAVPEIRAIYKDLSARWKKVHVRANSIGTLFSMYALQNEQPGKTLFVSPLVDMEQLILGMMAQSGVTETMLEQKGEIETDFEETLSWKYLSWIRSNPLVWNRPSEILYGTNDNLTGKNTMEQFCVKNACRLTTVENGEHWFHTEEQLKALHDWEERELKR